VGRPAPQTYGPRTDGQTDVSRTPGARKLNPLRCHEEHAEHLADARETTRVDLTDVYRLRLKQLLEQNPVVRVLARRDANSVCPECAPNRGVPQNIIRSRGFLNKPTAYLVFFFLPPHREEGAPGLDLLERRHIVDRLLHVPDLVRVDHEHGPGRPRILPTERWTARVARRVSVREVLRVVDD
jgi:hypothetical protein